MTSPQSASRLPSAMLLTFDVDCGEQLFPGHRVRVRGLVDDGRSRSDLTGRDCSRTVECQLVSLAYELRPGVTRAEEAAHGPGPFTLDATYDTDVPLPWSTGGSGPDGLAGPSSVEVPDEQIWGGESTWGALGPWPVPEGARRLTFWLWPVDASRALGTVTVDLRTGSAAWRRLEGTTSDGA